MWSGSVDDGGWGDEGLMWERCSALALVYRQKRFPDRWIGYVGCHLTFGMSGAIKRQPFGGNWRITGPDVQTTHQTDNDDDDGGWLMTALRSHYTLYTTWYGNQLMQVVWLVLDGLPVVVAAGRWRWCGQQHTDVTWSFRGLCVSVSKPTNGKWSKQARSGWLAVWWLSCCWRMMRWWCVVLCCLLLNDRARIVVRHVCGEWLCAFLGSVYAVGSHIYLQNTLSLIGGGLARLQKICLFARISRVTDYIFSEYTQ